MPLSPPVQVHQATAARASARLLNGLVVQGRGDTLQAEPCGEQPLDDVIMQVTGDAPPIYQDTEPLLIGSSVAEFQSDGRLTWCARGVDLACVKINEPKPRRPSLIMYRLQSTNVSIKASTRLRRLASAGLEAFGGPGLMIILSAVARQTAFDPDLRTRRK